MITQNYDDILASVISAKNNSKLNQDVTLIAVSKTKPAEAIEELYNHNVRDFGENKVQELCEKYEVLPKDIRWHLIGHLQTNKVKYIVDKAYLIHSVDSVRLAEVIEKEAEKKNLTVNILVQVNISNEDTKFGLDSDEVFDMIAEISKFKHIKINGLMTVAPFVDNPEDNREVFRKLKQLSVDINNKNIDNVCMNILSMGMSGDYEVAINEGATMVRIGTSIFGERNYNR